MGGSKTILWALGFGLLTLAITSPVSAKSPPEIKIFRDQVFRSAFLSNITPELFDWSVRKHWTPEHSQELWLSFERLAAQIPFGKTAILWASRDHFDKKSEFTAKRLLLVRNGKFFVIIHKDAKRFPKLNLAPHDVREGFKEGQRSSALFTFEGKKNPEELFVTQFSELVAESQNSTHLLGMVVDNKTLDSEIIPHLDLLVEAEYFDPASDESAHINTAVLEQVEQESLDYFFQDDHWIGPSLASIVSTVLFENEPEQFIVPLPKPFRMNAASKLIHFVTPRITTNEFIWLAKNAAIIGTCIAILKMLDFPNFGKN